jgi:hypothetical protein
MLSFTGLHAEIEKATGRTLTARPLGSIENLGI